MISPYWLLAAALAGAVVAAVLMYARIVQISRFAIDRADSRAELRGYRRARAELAK